MNLSLQYSVVCILLLGCLYSCQNSAESSKKAAVIEKQVQAQKSEMPDLNEFKKVEVETKDKAPDKAKIETKKAAIEPKVKAETLVKSEQKPKAKDQPKQKPKIAKRPAIVFEEPVHDFGEITEGDIIKHKFKFTNTGNADLVIKSAHASCGCTDPSYPFMATPPGEEGFIGLTYNSVSKDGPQKPEVTIKTNADNNSFVLYLTGNVKPKEKEENEEKSDSTEVKKKN